MKQKISYSSIMSGLSITFIVVFIAIFVLFWVFINKPFDNVFFWILVGLFGVFFLWLLFSIPYSVDADDDYVSEYRPLHKRKIRISDIKSVEPTYENNGFHLHGKFKSPILITLKDGRSYVIGSEDSKEFIDYINGKLSQS